MAIIPTRWTDTNTKKYIEATKVSPRDMVLSYAVRDNYGRGLDKNGHWQLEPSPSNRTEEFLSNCRFDTLAQATEALERIQEIEKQ